MITGQLFWTLCSGEPFDWCLEGLIFEQRPERSEEGSHVRVWRKDVQEGGTAKALRQERPGSCEAN